MNFFSTSHVPLVHLTRATCPPHTCHLFTSYVPPVHLTRATFPPHMYHLSTSHVPPVHLTCATCPPHTILIHCVAPKYPMNSTNHEAPHFDLLFHIISRIYMHLFVVVTDRLCCRVRLVLYYKSNIHVLPTRKVIHFTVKSVQYFSSTFRRYNSASVQEIRDTKEVPPLVANSHCSFQNNSIVSKL